jgi:N-acetylneuraminic acid mutarotase
MSRIRRTVASSKRLFATIEAMEPRRLLCTYHDFVGTDHVFAPAAATVAPLSAPLTATPFAARFNFQPESATTVPDGYRADIGRDFGRRANRMSYGWSAPNEQWMVQRASNVDERLNTVGHFGEQYWEVAVPSGTYRVTIGAGDPDFINSRYRVDAEGVRMFNFTPTDSNRFIEATQIVRVTDGRLTISSAAGAINNKINYIDIESYRPPIAPDGPPITPDGWQTGAPSPVARLEAQQAVYAGKLYVFGGYHNVSFEMTRRADVYDPATDQWTRLADLPTPLTHAATVGDGKNILLIGGYADESRALTTTNVWKYDTRKNQYFELPPLPAARGAGAAAILGTDLHFFGGQIRSERSAYVSDSANHWIMDLTNVEAGWRAAAPLPNMRNHLGGAAADGRVFAIGGQKGDDEYSGNQDDVHYYDPATDRWYSAAQLPEPLGHINASTFVHRGHIFTAGGAFNALNKTNESNAIYSYDIASDSWTRIATLPVPRKSAAANMIDGELILSGGGAWEPKIDTFRAYFWPQLA